MGNQLQLFKYPDKPVRTVTIDGDPWFVAKDVCEILEIGNSRMALDRIGTSMKGVHSIDTLGGNQQMSVINEAGVYKLAFTSRKEGAEQFTDWVASDVLPSIRRHGAYMTPETIEKVLLNPDMIISLASRLKAEQERNAALTEKI
jgi:prophage antirepressor-like protein